MEGFGMSEQISSYYVRIEGIKQCGNVFSRKKSADGMRN